MCKAMWFAVLAGAWLTLAGRACLADGGVITLDTTAEDAARSADQRAVLIYDSRSRRETMLLSTRYVGSPADFAWVIPVPTLPDAAQISTLPGGEEAFSELDRSTAPRAVVSGHGVGGCSGCLPVVGGGAGSEAGVAVGVEVVERLQVNGMSIALLNAQSSADLATWLSGNGYRVPANAVPVFEHYIGKQWHFVAVRLELPDAAAGRQSPVSAYFPEEPLKLSFATDQLIFPMRISTLSTGPEGATVLLYLLAEHRMRAVTNPTLPMVVPSGSFATTAGFESAYNQAFDALLASASPRPLVVEYVAPPGTIGVPTALQSLVPPDQPLSLTRLRTHFRPEDMTDDLAFTAADSDAPFSVLARSGRPLPGAGFTLALVLAMLTMAARTGRGGVRRALRDALFVGALAACALVGM